MASKKRRVRKYKWTKRLNKHGFLKRMLSADGRKMLARRRRKGRQELSPQKKGKNG